MVSLAYGFFTKFLVKDHHLSLLIHNFLFLAIFLRETFSKYKDEFQFLYYLKVFQQLVLPLIHHFSLLFRPSIQYTLNQAFASLQYSVFSPFYHLFLFLCLNLGNCLKNFPFLLFQHIEFVFMSFTLCCQNFKQFNFNFDSLLRVIFQNKMIYFQSHQCSLNL